MIFVLLVEYTTTAALRLFFFFLCSHSRGRLLWNQSNLGINKFLNRCFFVIAKQSRFTFLFFLNVLKSSAAWDCSSQNILTAVDVNIFFFCVVMSWFTFHKHFCSYRWPLSVYLCILVHVLFILSYFYYYHKIVTCRNLSWFFCSLIFFLVSVILENEILSRKALRAQCLFLSWIQRGKQPLE